MNVYDIGNDDQNGPTGGHTIGGEGCPEGPGRSTAFGTSADAHITGHTMRGPKPTKGHVFQDGVRYERSCSYH